MSTNSQFANSRWSAMPLRYYRGEQKATMELAHQFFSLQSSSAQEIQIVVNSFCDGYILKYVCSPDVSQYSVFKRANTAATGMRCNNITTGRQRQEEDGWNQTPNHGSEDAPCAMAV